MLVDKNNAILLTRRADRIFFSRAWVCPGGHVDSGESLEETALRELHEECGIELLTKKLDYSIEPVCIFESTTQPRKPEES